MDKKWALFSVFDKTGVVDDARRLVKLGWRIISSGGTAKALSEAGVPVMDVAELVGGGAILGHRVVTLSRQIHAGLLADANKSEDLAELEKLGIPFIDMVRCDFYPLSQAIADPSATIVSVVEKTDIGGPCMVRSAAKGLRIVVCRREDMESVLLELEQNGDVSIGSRCGLRARAEFEVSRYVGDSAVFHGGGKFEVITGERVAEFKGENGPQTPAALFSRGTDDPLALDKFQLVEGSAPSYNNMCDVDRLLQTMTHIAAAWGLNYGLVPFIAVGGKHGNPCGAAVGNYCLEKMVKGDTRAIFGGLIMANFALTELSATTMAEAMPDGKARFDGVIAPAFNQAAIGVLARAKGKCRLMQNPALSHVSNECAALDKTPRFRYVRGGLLAQPNYTFILDFKHPDLKVYGDRKPGLEPDLLLAWAVGCTSNSNTITIVKNGMLIGNGVGQQDRVGAAELAVKRATDAGHKDQLNGAVAYSDSFFPFPDGVEVLIDAGIKVIFSTSGSVKDKEVQELCMARGVTLYQLPDSIARGFFGH